MKVGSKWKLFIPSNLAYGEQRMGEDIKPHSTLIFEMELLGIEPKVPAIPVAPVKKISIFALYQKPFQFPERLFLSVYVHSLLQNRTPLPSLIYINLLIFNL
jgi:hypothetical protein